MVEHRVARLAQLGVRQARYFGRHKTLFQVLMLAAVANLTLVLGHALPGEPAVAVLVGLFFLSAALTTLNRTLGDLGRTKLGRWAD